jgi:hypothetical protein
LAIEEVKSAIYDNWDEVGTGIAKSAVTWVTYKPETIAALEKVNIVFSFYPPSSGGATWERVGFNLWKIIEPVSVDVYIKTSIQTLSDAISKRNIIENEIVRILIARSFVKALREVTKSETEMLVRLQLTVDHKSFKFTSTSP